MNKCRVCVERRVSDVETWDSGSILTGGHILLEFFCFHIVKPLMATLRLLLTLCITVSDNTSITYNVDIVEYYRTD